MPKVLDSNTPIIASYVLDRNGSGKKISADEILQWKPEDGLLWLHFNFEHEHVRNWLDNKLHLDPILVDALCADESRPRCTTIENGLLTILRGLNHNAGAEPEDMVSIRIWIEQGRVITARRRYMLTEDDLIKSIENGNAPRTTSELLTDIALYITSRMHEVIEAMDERLDELEQFDDIHNTSNVQKTLTDVRREIIQLKRFMAPQKEVMKRLTTEFSEWFTRRDELNLKEVNDSLMRHIEDLDENRERVHVIQEQLFARLSELNNQRMYVLSIIAAIFLPLSFATGLLGINVGGIPGSENPGAFAIVSITLTVVALVLFLLLKVKKWM